MRIVRNFRTVAFRKVYWKTVVCEGLLYMSQGVSEKMLQTEMECNLNTYTSDDFLIPVFGNAPFSSKLYSLS